jgi:hypothetical protein
MARRSRAILDPLYWAASRLFTKTTKRKIGRCSRKFAT